MQVRKCGLCVRAVYSEYDRRDNLPPFVAVAPPFEVGGMRVRSGHVQVPQGEVAQMIGGFVFITSRTVVHKAAPTGVYQRSTRLCGMGFEAGVIAPGYVP